MPVPDRDELAAKQLELVRSLLGRAEPPEGFNEDRLRAAGEALAQKRMHAAGSAWPSLADAFGPEFGSLFSSYAREVSLPLHGGPLADGRNFARWLEHRGRLPESGKLQTIAVDLEYKQTPAGLLPRRGPWLRIAWLKQSRQVLLAVRLSSRMRYRWRIPLGPRRSGEHS